MKRRSPRAAQGLAVAAGLVTVALTVAAFALSYKHLHTVAVQHGVAEGVAAWAWPGTVDLFIVAGELLILRATLQGRVDKFAVFLTSVGSVGSIALNVAGVGGGHGPMDYVVAAVPPTGALIAFGAVMRQIHEYMTHLAAPEVEQPATGETPAPISMIDVDVMRQLMALDWDTPRVDETPEPEAETPEPEAETPTPVKPKKRTPRWPNRLSDEEARHMALEAYVHNVPTRKAEDAVTRSHSTIARMYEQFEKEGVKRMELLAA